MGIRQHDQLREHNRRLAEIETRIARLPVREASLNARDPLSVVSGQVDEIGGVAGGDTTFQVDNVALLAGVDPRSDPASATEEIEATNTLAQDYNDNDRVILFQFAPGGQWHTDKSAAGTGDQIKEFELVENMAYSDTAKNAKPLDASHNLDAGAPSVKLVDLDGKWYGRAAYTSTAGSERGYRFFARFFDSNYQASGLQGWEILAGEGPTPLLRVTLVNYSANTYNVSPDKAFGGGWSHGRLPAEESGSYDLTATDPDNLAQRALSSDPFLAAWVREDAQYRLVARLTPEDCQLAKVTVSGVSAATFATGTLTYGTGTANPLEDQGDGTADVNATTTITVYNSVPSAVDGDKIVQLKRIRGLLFVDVEPCSDFT